MADELNMRHLAVPTPAGSVWPRLLERVRRGLMVRSHSGKVRPGEVFVALPGTKVAGEAFIPEALARGAAYVVAATARNWPQGDDATGAELIIHPDPAAALGELAQAHFGTDKHRFWLVGITGTNGKTTVSYIVEYLLAYHGLRAGVLGTVNYRWPSVVIESSMTTPDCWKTHELLANMARANVDAVVMEVSSHALAQQRVAGLSFDVAVMTNLTQDHLDYHSSMEEYFRAKAMLFTQYATAQATSVLNYEDPFCLKLLRVLPSAIGYGLDEPPTGSFAKLRGKPTRMDASGLELDVSYNEAMRWQVESQLVGRHNAMNLLAAQAVGLALGLSPQDMRALAGFAGVPGRLERVANDRGLNIFVDYAHTPDALDNVLSAVRRLGVRKLVTVFGCGGDRDRTKRPLMAEAVCRHADVAVLTSDNPRHEDPLDIMADARPGLSGCARVVEEVDRRAAIALALAEIGPEDALVIAGKGHETYQQVGDVKHPFSDVAVTRELLGEAGPCA